ncbi:MAG: HNH endonuclease family protein, partial [Ktedonobacterales bacterium]
SAYRIFSILHDRGLDLSSADILKADIIGQIPEEAQQTYTARWEDTEELLGREAFDDLLGHIRTIHRKIPQPRETMLDEFRAHVIAVVGDSQRVIDDLVVPYGRAYDVVLHASYQHPDGADRVNESLSWLNHVDHMDWVPPAIRYLSLYHESSERLARFFAELERLAASLMIRRQYAHRRIPRYARLLAAIERGDDLSLPGSPIQLSAEEREATLGALSGDFYLMSARPRQYVLLRLDSSLAGTEAVYKRRAITVEHVLPRNPAQNSEWLRTFPTLEERARYVHRLGNLALLSGTKNSNASNYDFARKKQVYFAARNGVAPFALTTQVLQEEEWTPAVIERRQQQLLDHLKQLWRL